MYCVCIEIEKKVNCVLVYFRRTEWLNLKLIAELAVKNDGKIVGLKVETIANLGGYASLFATVTPTYLYGPLVLGLYDIPVAFCNVKAVYTNTAPVDAYRGAGRPEATYMIERLVEKAAKEMGIDRAEFRNKNFISKFPHQQCLVHNVDSGDYSAHLNKALELADYKNFENRRTESKSCLLYTSPSPRDRTRSRMPSSA